VSVALALEYEEVLKRAGLIPGLTVADIDIFLDYIFRNSSGGRGSFEQRRYRLRFAV